MPQVMTQEVFSQVPVPVMKPVDVPVLTPVVSPWRESRRGAQPQIVEWPVPVRQEMMQDERRDHTGMPVCDKKSVVAINTLERNANAAEELVIAMMFNSAKNKTHCCTMSV